MTQLAPILQAFFTTRLASQYGASTHTIAAYRDSWRLLLRYAAQATGTAPAALDLSQMDTDLITGFLTHLETERGNSTTTRNTRLAAVHSLFSYAAYHHPEHAATISRVLAIPAKRAHRTHITYLSPSEVTALLAAPDRSTVAGRRDHALIQVAVTTGMRVSELTALKLTDVHLGTAPHVVCHGKGRKDRITPLDRQTVRVLRELTAKASTAEAFVFPTRAGTQMSRDAVAARLALHTVAAAQACPSMTRKNVTAHVLRHTAAMRLLAAGIDSSVIALWLGHESIETTQIYLHANMKTKEDALARTKPTGTKPGRYKVVDDALLAFLQAL
jgi:site-specific recombinase XerD